ncbi:hypothetical protein ACIQWA_34935 [Kitasatospora sp. NPDC098652]|uniref:hypothetical protein n=1 Tax=Kitasatospora sp. NPDC098652 TaxID=3364095 RepID=UPI0038209023
MPLVAGGIGRGALTARYALAKMERERLDHQTRVYFSYNGTAPIPERESPGLEQLGNWPLRPRLLKLVSGDFKNTLSDDDFDDHFSSSPNTGTSLITKELGSWLIDRTQ